MAINITVLNQINVVLQEVTVQVLIIPVNSSSINAEICTSVTFLVVVVASVDLGGEAPNIEARNLMIKRLVCSGIILDVVNLFICGPPIRGGRAWIVIC